MVEADGAIRQLAQATVEIFIDWHAVEAMKKHFKESGYQKYKIDKKFKNKIKINISLTDITWQYVKSMTINKFNINR